MARPAGGRAEAPTPAGSVEGQAGWGVDGLQVLMRGSERLGALDLTRFFAISMMFVCHWVGILERFPGTHADVLLWLGRSATPGFVTVFGFTAGYVFWSRHLADPVALRASFLARALRTAKYALLVSTPVMAVLLYERSWSPSQWAFSTYSVLAFYALAIPSMLPVFALLRRRPAVLAPLLGAALWVAGDVLRAVWPQSPRLWIEYPRLLLVSGTYAYLNLMGLAVMVLPLGIFVHERTGERRAAALRTIALAGAAACAVGLLAGVLSDGFSARAVIDGHAKYPPRPWYFLHYAGLTLCLLGALGATQARFPAMARWVHPLEILGGAPLKIYAAHAFVLPATAFLSWGTGVPTELSFALSFAALVAYFASLVRTGRRPPIPPPSEGGCVAEGESPG